MSAVLYSVLSLVFNLPVFRVYVTKIRLGLTLTGTARIRFVILF